MILNNAYYYLFYNAQALCSLLMRPTGEKLQGVGFWLKIRKNFLTISVMKMELSYSIDNVLLITGGIQGKISWDLT